VNKSYLPRLANSTHCLASVGEGIGWICTIENLRVARVCQVRSWFVMTAQKWSRMKLCESSPTPGRDDHRRDRCDWLEPHYDRCLLPSISVRRLSRHSYLTNGREFITLAPAIVVCETPYCLKSLHEAHHFRLLNLITRAQYQTTPLRMNHSVQVKTSFSMHDTPL